MRDSATTKRCVSSPQFRFERAVAPQKKNLAPQLRALAICCLERVMHDQQIVCLLVTEHFHSNECCFDNNGMNTIRRKVLHSLQPGERLSTLADEPNVVTKVRHFSGTFAPRQNICILLRNVDVKPLP